MHRAKGDRWVRASVLHVCDNGTFANSEDPDEMQQIAAFHQDLHGL